MGYALLEGYSLNGQNFSDIVLSMGLKTTAFTAQHVTNACMCKILDVSIQKITRKIWLGPILQIKL